MKIQRHSLGDHIRLLAPLFGLIAAVWALRLVVYAAGAPGIVIHFVSVTLAGAVSLLLAVLLIHLKRFGGYASVFVCAFLLQSWAHLLIAGAIAFAALTGTSNVYTAPEFIPHMPQPISLWRHMFGHLTFGVGTGTLFGSAMGCLLLWVLRHLIPLKPEGDAGQFAQKPQSQSSAAQGR